MKIVYNVQLFGVCGDGTDETSRVQAAYDALPAEGGELFFPPTDSNYKFNLTITKNNVHVRGCSCAKVDLTGEHQKNAFVPADTSKPVIQVGDDSGYVRGFRITDCTLFGTEGPTYGSTGLYFAGGAIEAFARNVAVWNFKINIKIREEPRTRAC